MKQAGRMMVGLMMCVTALPAFGQSAPEGFRELKWGATQEQVSREFPYAVCKAQQRELSDWDCTVYGGETINGVPVLLILGGYTTGRAVGFSRFMFSFPSAEVRRIVDAFESRYGRPTRVEEEEFVTRGGARVPNAIWQWDFPNAIITVRQYGSRLDRAMAVVALHAANAESQERTAQRKRGAGKGL